MIYKASMVFACSALKEVAIESESLCTNFSFTVSHSHLQGR